MLFTIAFADRWLISDFAFPSFPGSSFWQCIGVSQTSDPVSGGWNLYAVQVDRQTLHTLATIRSSRCGTPAEAQTKTPISSRSTCLAARLPSTASTFMLLTAPACSPAVRPIRSALDSNRDRCGRFL